MHGTEKFGFERMVSRTSPMMRVIEWPTSICRTRDRVHVGVLRD